MLTSAKITLHVSDLIERNRLMMKFCEKATTEANVTSAKFPIQPFYSALAFANRISALRDAFEPCELGSNSRVGFEVAFRLSVI